MHILLNQSTKKGIGDNLEHNESQERCDWLSPVTVIGSHLVDCQRALKGLKSRCDFQNVYESARRKQQIYDEHTGQIGIPRIALGELGHTCEG